MTFRMEKGRDVDLISALKSRFGYDGVSPMSLVSPTELPAFEKYDEYIPAELLRHAYAADRLDTKEAAKRIADIAREYSI